MPAPPSNPKNTQLAEHPNKSDLPARHRYYIQSMDILLSCLPVKMIGLAPQSSLTGDISCTSPKSLLYLDTHKSVTNTLGSPLVKQTGCPIWPRAKACSQLATGNKTGSRKSDSKMITPCYVNPSLAVLGDSWLDYESTQA